MNINKQTILAIGIGAAALVAVGLIWSASAAQAADLGGTCCADLEERIAELEATTARKGNRKVSLNVYGQVNAGLLRIDAFDFQRTNVTQNGTDETYVGFSGAARVNSDLMAGYVLELDMHDLGLLGAPVSSFQPRVRQSHWYLKSETLGKVSVGKLASATQDFDRITTANTSVVAKPLSLGGLSDAYLTGIDLPFDGTYRDGVRYDTPTWGGFVASASWGNSFSGTDPDGNGDTWDLALRYAGEQSGFRFAGGLGYRKSTDIEINLLNVATINFPTGDVETMLAVGSVMHMQSGIFVTANWADQDYKDANFTLKGYQVQAGLEQKQFSFGKTTLYGEYGQITLEQGANEADVDLWGLGVVQALDAAAMDLYVGYRTYDLGDLSDQDVDVIQAGARIRF